MTIQEIEKLWALWDAFKETAEQHDFVHILIVDIKMERLYRDLHENWSEDHAKIFAEAMRLQVFPYFGIKEFIRMKPAVTATIRKKEDCRDLIRQLASEGKSLKEIMELTGKSEPTVRKYMKEAESDS